MTLFIKNINLNNAWEINTNDNFLYIKSNSNIVGSFKANILNNNNNEFTLPVSGQLNCLRLCINNWKIYDTNDKLLFNSLDSTQMYFSSYA